MFKIIKALVAIRYLNAMTHIYEITNGEDRVKVVAGAQRTNAYIEKQLGIK